MHFHLLFNKNMLVIPRNNNNLQSSYSFDLSLDVRCGLWMTLSIFNPLMEQNSRETVTALSSLPVFDELY